MSTNGLRPLDPQLAAALAGLSGADCGVLRRARVLLGGIGNIGSFLAPLIARNVGFLRLVDRGRVEARNAANQDYVATSDVGKFKVEVLAARLRRDYPGLTVEAIAADLEDVPFGQFADVHLCLGALDSLRARQVLISERALPLGLPVVDGGVGEPHLGRVHVFVPGSACAECHWQPEHYRQLARETPCVPDSEATAPPTLAPAFVGATVAGIMAAEAVNVLTGRAPADSLEIAFDLANRKFVTSRMRRAPRCRFDHEIVQDRFDLDKSFATATAQDLLAALRRHFGLAQVQLEVRRRLFGGGMLGSDRFVSPLQLETCADRPLADLGLTPRDYIRVRVPGQPPSAFLRLAPTDRCVEDTTNGL